ncbi:MinD superfamily P-loop ATPase containing an inserted ferredoxin domain [Olavius algarvensis Delta 1 endosymbiont]|nr:MinD superfamily P-loop ATPase containing an inserted ferredoxin domain [Olavius algarvensis Delta 1 endosymbiont]
MSMKELVILSGKGGTGKTSLTAAFASISNGSVLCDADVDAADLHLLMDPDIQKSADLLGGQVAAVDFAKCSRCGYCIELCRFGAIDQKFVVDEVNCEGCGVCVDLCPEQAIDFPTKKCGEWFVSDTRYGAMVHARLGIAEENSGKLVTLVRQEAQRLTEVRQLEMIITDGPPGVGCPVIATLGGATAVLVVTEPTVSGRHDLRRLLDLADHFNVPGLICVNKFDLNLDQTAAIEALATERTVPVVGKIPFNPQFTESMVQGHTVCEHDRNSDLCRTIRRLWNRILDTI